MSEYSAKALRDARKAKAEKMGAADPQQKVDSSTWTPPELLKADVKTGLRPLSRRAFKSGGKVSGDANDKRADKAPRKKDGGATAYANAKVNRNVKDANSEREGAKHVGGMKSGGRAGKLSGGALGRYAQAAANEVNWRGSKAGKAKEKAERSGLISDRKDADEQERKASKRTRGLEMAISKLSGARPTVGETAKVPATRDEIPMKKGGRTKWANGGELPKNPPMPPRRSDYFPNEGKEPEAKDLYSKEDLKRLEQGRKHGGRTKKMNGGPMGDPRLGIVQPNRMKFTGAQGTPYKKGGAAHGDEAMDKALIKKMVKPSALEKCEGGPVKRMARKDGGRAKGKTNINIIIGQPKEDTQVPPGMPMGARPPGMPVPAPAPAPGGMPPGGAPPMPMPPGAGPGGPSMPPPSMMGRKTGGRVTKIAKSYKDMEAGAASGEGRLQKTDIAKRLPKPREDGKNVYDGLGYPNKVPGATGGRTARKSGGGVYRSYKDMDAGAGSGEGRLEKAEIQHSKRGR